MRGSRGVGGVRMPHPLEKSQVAICFLRNTCMDPLEKQLNQRPWEMSVQSSVKCVDDLQGYIFQKLLLAWIFSCINKTRNIFKKDIRRLSNTYNFNTIKWRNPFIPPCLCMLEKDVPSKTSEFGSCGYVSGLSFAWCSFRWAICIWIVPNFRHFTSKG